MVRIQKQGLQQSTQRRMVACLNCLQICNGVPFLNFLLLEKTKTGNKEAIAPQTSDWKRRSSAEGIESILESPEDEAFNLARYWRAFNVEPSAKKW